MYEENYYLQNVQIKLERKFSESSNFNEENTQQYNDNFTNIYEPSNDQSESFSDSKSTTGYDSEHFNMDEDVSIDIVEHPIKPEPDNEIYPENINNTLETDLLDNFEFDDLNTSEVLNIELGEQDIDSEYYSISELSNNEVDTQNSDDSENKNDQLDIKISDISELTNTQFETQNIISENSCDSDLSIIELEIDSENTNSTKISDDTDSSTITDEIRTVNTNFNKNTPQYIDEIFKDEETIESLLQFSYQCPYCHIKFPTSDNFREHLYITSKTFISKYKINSNYVQNQCKKCNMNFKNQYLFKRHIYKCKGCLKNDSTIWCEICQSDFLYICDLISHQHISNHNVDILKCSLCGEKFCNEMSLKEHASSTHGGKLSLSCQECKKSFPSISELIQHCDKYPLSKIEINTSKNHIYFTKNLNNTCSMNKFFIGNTNVLKISKTSVQKKYIECANCKFKFSNINYLNQHYVSHHASKNNLIEHVLENKMKANEKIQQPKKIEQPEKIKDNKNIEQLKKIRQPKKIEQPIKNDNELKVKIKDQFCFKKIRCFECLARFTSKEELTMHMSVHYPKGYYLCDYCLKMFARKCTLETHIRKLHFKKSFKCKKCTKKFYESQDLKKHVVQVHALTKKMKPDCYFPALSRLFSAGSIHLTS